MSIEKKAARGVAWNMLAGVGTRIVGLVGTLVLTHFLAPADYGEVSAAAICVSSASQFTFFAFNQYVIAHRSPPEVASQAARVHAAMVTAAMIVVYLLRGQLGALLDAPGMGRFVPGLAIAMVIDSARIIPAALLVRELRFRTVALINSAGELAFTATAVGLAWRLGGYAMMIATMVRSALAVVLYIAAAPRAQWLVRAPLQKPVVRSLYGYGAPIMFAAVADRASATWDNLIVLRLFGAQVMGAYALSYSLAETPLIYVAERMGDVLMPAFAKMAPADRPAAVVRGAGMMALVVAPLGVGLGAVAPSIVHVFFDTRWAGMASILTVLSVMTVFQPVAWSATAYLLAEKLPRVLMAMSILRVVVLLSLVALLGWLGGPPWACAGVGVGYTLHSIVTVVVTSRSTALSARAYFAAVVRPLLACVPMFVGVMALRSVLAAAGLPAAASLPIEVVAGAVTYVVSAFVLAGPNVRELLRLVRAARSKETADADDAPETAPPSTP